MSISDPKGRGIQVTIKYGKGYEETWVSFAGLPDEIRQDIVEYFDLDPDSIAGLSLSAVVVTATNLAHAKGTLASTFGATVIPNDTPPWKPEQSKPQGDVWAAAGQPAQASPPAQPEKDPMFAVIEAETTIAGLQRLYAENAEAFQNPELLAAWKAKGKSLKGAA
ncbi:hypothetical protein [Micromonospora sp. GCM10011541]|uniref:hypothetical protein n=1 Tax=Micromonospora sp. GCM10011541 TaxID=3317336 RepID=UPI0036200573